MWLVFKWKLGFVYIRYSQSGYKLNDALPFQYPQSVPVMRRPNSKWTLARGKREC